MKFWIARATHDRRVRELFSDLRVFAKQAGGPLAMELEARARRRTPGWKAEFEQVTAALEAVGKLNPDQAAYLRRYLSDCRERRVLYAYAFMAVVWTLLVMATASRAWLNQPGLDFTVALFLLGVGVVVSWILLSLWRGPAPSHWVELRRLALALSAGLAASIGVVGLGGEIMMQVVQDLSIEDFAAQREAELHNPAGYTALKKFAKEAYGVDVVLGTDVDSWASTSTRQPGGSVAAMSNGPGYCALSLNRAKLLSTFNFDNGPKNATWVQGVLFHELGHCLDGARDQSRGQGHYPALRSVAPADAAAVVDPDSFLAALAKPSTQLWREALADLFAVGYWRLQAGAAASTMIDRLEAIRKATANADPSHATACWIEQGRRAPAPQSLTEVLAWADDLRSRSPCSVSAVPGQPIAFLPIKRFARWVAHLMD